MADAATELEHRGIVRTLKDLFAGAAGGVAQVLLGMGFPLPFLLTADIGNGASYLVTCLGRFLSIAPKTLDFCLYYWHAIGNRPFADFRDVLQSGGLLRSVETRKIIRKLVLF
jgi:hypothetical protein